MQLKQFLKGFDFLVIPIRVRRKFKDVWQETKTSYYREKHVDSEIHARTQAIETYLNSHNIRSLQIGTGDNPLPGWLNTDLEPTSSDVIFLDALAEFPFEDQVFDYVFSEHMIEHINYKGGLFMLKECFRVLKSGGKVRIATPNVEKIIGLYSPTKTEAQQRYIKWSSVESLGLYSPEKSRLQQGRPEWDLDHNHINRHFPDVNQDPVCFIVNNFFRSYGHQFLYDSKTLKAVFEEAGFVDVVSYAPGESNDEILMGIESHSNRIGDEMNRFETMILEATKP